MVVRRWHIHKVRRNWHIYTSANVIGGPWKLVNVYDTFEEARERVVTIVNFYNRMKEHYDHKT